MIYYDLLCAFSKNGIRGHLKDTTDTWAIFAGSGDSEVASFSPAGAPGVTDDPEVLTILSSVSHEVHGVINIGPASRAAYDSTLVKHKGARSCSDGDRDGLVLQSCDVAIDISALN